jgi:hypothetical protein
MLQMRAKECQWEVSRLEGKSAKLSELYMRGMKKGLWIEQSSNSELLNCTCKSGY